MKKNQFKHHLPMERTETIRKTIIGILEDSLLSVKDISVHVKIPEKEVYEHLEHIRRTMESRKDCKFKTYPPCCRKCGFEFIKRDKLKKPGKCPICRSESIKNAKFTIERSC